MFEQLSGKQQKVMLTILPYAGGGSYGFSNWHNGLKEDVDLKIIDYPGHGIRIREALIEDFEKLVVDVVEQLNSVDIESTVLFGHSMGGMVSAYVAEEIYKKKRKIFRAIIISCCKAPEFFGENKSRSINDSELINYLKTERDIPKEVIETREFMNCVYPAIKNDFRMLQEYIYKHLKIPSCPIHCICADDDYGVTLKKMQAWERYTDENIIFHSISGSHFYFEEYPSKTFKLIRKILKSL